LINLKFEVPTWDEIYEMLLQLADMIRKEGYKPEVIVGISRGGWPPARVMSDLLENQELANVRVEFYAGVAERREEPVITQPLSVTVKGRKVLVMDDVADTGKSLKLVKDHVIDRGASEVQLATIYYKPWSIILPDYYVKETEAWIVFPWERKETVRNILRRCREENIPIKEMKNRLIEGGFNQDLLERFLREIMEETGCEHSNSR